MNSGLTRGIILLVLITCSMLLLVVAGAEPAGTQGHAVAVGQRYLTTDAEAVRPSLPEQ